MSQSGVTMLAATGTEITSSILALKELYFKKKNTFEQFSINTMHPRPVDDSTWHEKKHEKKLFSLPRVSGTAPGNGLQHPKELQKVSHLSACKRRENNGDKSFRKTALLCLWHQKCASKSLVFWLRYPNLWEHSRFILFLKDMYRQQFQNGCMCVLTISRFHDWFV